MKKEKRIRNIIITIFVFFVSLSHHIAVGEIKEVELGIDGLSCPFCVVGLRKQVERIGTIKNMDISLKEAIARVTLKEKTILNIEDYKEAVRKSGFSVREIKIMAEGEIITYGDFLALKVTGTNQIFILSDAKELKAGAKIPDSGGHSIFLSPGLQYVTERFILEGSIQLPVIQDLNGSQLETDYIITAGTRITF